MMSGVFSLLEAFHQFYLLPKIGNASKGNMARVEFQWKWTKF